MDVQLFIMLWPQPANVRGTTLTPYEVAILNCHGVSVLYFILFCSFLPSVIVVKLSTFSKDSF